MGAQQYALLLKKLATGMISVTSALVFALGFLIWYSATSTVPDYAMLSQSAAVSTKEAQLTLTNKREPSSIPTQIFEAAKESVNTNTVTKLALPKPAAIETVALGCLKDGMRLEIKSQAKRVRLRARLCDEHTLTLEESTMVNRANGFEATLFKIEDGSFTSDYISLDSGRNQIMYQLKNDKGERSTGEVTIDFVVAQQSVK